MSEMMEGILRVPSHSHYFDGLSRKIQSVLIREVGWMVPLIRTISSKYVVF